MWMPYETNLIFANKSASLLKGGFISVAQHRHLRTPTHHPACHVFICSSMINQEQHLPTHLCRLWACAFTCTIAACVCVCVYVLTFPSLQYRGFLGSGLLKVFFLLEALELITVWGIFINEPFSCPCVALNGTQCHKEK